jgi:RND family efflux transporter MFP subunit
MALTRSKGNDLLSFSGSTEATATVSLGFMVGGKVGRVMVDEGSKVSKGTLIADLETTDYALALDIANANLQKVQDEYNRLTILRDRGSLPASDYVKATADLNELTAKQKQAIKSLTDCRLYSPIPGIVSRKGTNPGEVVSPGTSLFSIVDINPIRAVVAVNRAISRMLCGFCLPAYRREIQGAHFVRYSSQRSVTIRRIEKIHRRYHRKNAYTNAERTGG